MSDETKNKDIFLESIGKIKPLKKSNKRLKELNLLNIKTTKKVEITTNLKHTSEKTKPKTKSNKNNLLIESYSIEKKLKKGKLPVNKKVDFHGLSLDKAREKFFNTINECYYFNERCILFITGKGMKKTNLDTKKIKLFYGKIREDFQRWVIEKDVVSKILSVVPADSSHGGDGAFIVYLRKNKN